MTTNVSKAFGEAMQALARRKAPLQEGGVWPADATTGPRGGYLVPIELSLRIEFILRERSTFVRFATRQPMTSATCRVPVLDTASGRLGGVTLSWIAEAAAKPGSEPVFASRTLISHDLACSAVVSDQLLADGGAPLGTFLETLFAYALEWSIDDACFNGPAAGTDRPSGVLNAPAAVTAATPAAMLGLLLPECYPNAIWSAHPSAIATLATDAGYRPAVDTELPSLAGILYGRPLIATAHLPANGLLLWDPTLYILGWRQFEIESSPHPLFTTNQTVFRLVWRGDGGPRLAAAIGGLSAYVKKGP
jgi:HK97 family phage major capsid protein